MCQVWRLNLKPGPDKGILPEDVLSFCQRNNVLGVGWREIKIRTDDYWELKTATSEIYPGDKGVLKAINAIKDMALDDLIYTRFSGIYYLCRVKGKWIDSMPTEEHYRHDIYNYVEVEWNEIGTEDSVPGRVLNSFGPSATVQRVSEVDNISKLLWNNLSKSDFTYKTEPIGLNDFWQSISSEDLECLILTYLQFKGYYIISTTLKRSTAKVECIMIKNDGSHKCFPQVKRECTLYGKDYECFLRNSDDRVFLFTTSQEYIGCGHPQIECLTKAEIEDFFLENKNLLTSPVLSWVKICDKFLQ